MPYTLVTLPGDGIGPEVLEQGLRVLDKVSTNNGIEWSTNTIACGGKFYLEHGHEHGDLDWPSGSFERCKAADMILLGAVGWPRPTGCGPVTMSNGKMAGFSPVIGNRVGLDLYANVRPVKLYPGVKHRIHGRPTTVWQHNNVDMLFVRENTEGLYTPTGGKLSPGGVDEVAIDSRVITRKGSERIIRFAFEQCRHRSTGAPSDGKRRVTAIVKDNVLHGCQLFRDLFFQIGEEYPDVEKETCIIDAFTQALITTPEHYNVCVTTNMFGDIVTDLAAVLQGGMGMAAGANIGDHHGMFEPIHGSAPPLTGKNTANPIAMILSVAEGLKWLGAKKGDSSLTRSARHIEQAVIDILADGNVLPADLAEPGQAKACSAVGDAIALRL